MPREEYYGDPHERTSRQGVPQAEAATRHRYNTLADEAKSRAYDARRRGDKVAEAEAIAEMRKYRALASA